MKSIHAVFPHICVLACIALALLKEHELAAGALLMAGTAYGLRTPPPAV